MRELQKKCHCHCEHVDWQRSPQRAAKVGATRIYRQTRETHCVRSQRHRFLKGPARSTRPSTYRTDEQILSASRKVSNQGDPECYSFHSGPENELLRSRYSIP